jgi:pimeloyl-ACP methyl ester carboxylesterase
MDTEVEPAGPVGGAGDRGGELKRFTTSDGLSLAYADEGAGVPLLCLSGLTRTMRDFEPVVAAFGDVARIIRLDYRGRGASDHDAEWRNYNVAVEARDALELLDHLGLARTAVLGTSRGGLIALVLAVAARDRLLGVIFNDIGPEVDPAGMARILDYLGQTPAAPSLDALAELFAVQMQPEFPGVGVETWRWFLGNNMHDTGEGVALGYDPKLKDAVAEALDAGPAPDLWSAFDRLQGLPVVLLRGENSDVLSRETAAQMRARRPDMQYVPVRNRAHIPFLDEPECRQAIGQFLRDLPR